MTTPHISAKLGDFAETVLMPGDPLRAKYIADNFLTEVKQVNEVRNMLGFTGMYQGKPVSIMGSGMGVPSISIYSYELYKFFGVKNIIRVGSCGAIRPEIKLRDVIIAIGATTDSNVNKTRLKGYEFAATASYDLLESAVHAAREHKATVHVGNIFTADLFYGPDKEVMSLMAQYGVLAVEMEAAGLYGVAAECGTNALAICTVSDHILSGEQTTSEERQNSFNDMIEITLNSL